MPEFATARQRITEYLRQRRMQTRDLGNAIHVTYTDPKGHPAELTYSDLDEVMLTSTGLPSWTFFYAFHAAMDALKDHEAWAMGRGEDLTGNGTISYPVRCVSCPGQWHTYALHPEDARELFRGHQAGIIAARMRDTFQNPDKAEEQQLILDRVWHEGWDANDGDESPYGVAE
ncbi:hypothetical protein SEA_COLUCCI_69 [Arthrobacter phage Colucci]|uniref:Uncharacterized protein n=1 Tax=Arthrobacter phage Colucci TaxID=2015834 RepID=A0A286N2Y1_9CAUD|nr:hypothetical protein FDI27_gp069 [Arthrobacter phage Colucci]ASX98738.1 hypothetical protein SEA_COLUCCI_69 [Arthrobacter phage Colucci]